MTTIDSGSTYQLFEKSKLTSYMHGHVNSDNNKKKYGSWVKLNSMRMDKRNDYNKKSNNKLTVIIIIL